jgi:hypothetical protein
LKISSPSFFVLYRHFSLLIRKILKPISINTPKSALFYLIILFMSINLSYSKD